MPVASSIGQIYANQINFRQSIKDRIEDYIIITESAKFDPAVLRQQQAFLKTQQERVNALDNDLADLADRKDKTVGDLIQRFKAAEGQRIVATLQGQAKVLASANQAAGQAASARIRAKASVENGRMRLAGEQLKAGAAANDRAWDRVVEAEAEGDKGVSSLFDKAAEEGRASPIATADQLSAELDRMASIDWKAKLDQLSSPLAKKRWIENFIAASETYARSLASSSRKQAIDGELAAAGITVSDLALEALGLDPAQFKGQDDTAILEKELKDNGWKELPGVPGYDAGSITAVGLDLRRTLPPAPVAETPKLADAVGLASDENGTREQKEQEFIKRASYNYYLVDQADKDAPTITYEEFIGKDDVSKTYLDKAKSASFYELAKFGDKAYVDLILAKKGAEGDLRKAQSAYASAFSEIPSYEQVARKTLEAYSALYGGKKQQRMVALADYGRENLFGVDVYVDKASGKTILPPKTKEEEALFQERVNKGEISKETKTMQLDVPELEALGFATGMAGGGVKRKEEPLPEPKPKPPPVEKAVVVEEQEPFVPLEKPLEQTGFTGRIQQPPAGPDFPTERRELKPGEPNFTERMTSSMNLEKLGRGPSGPDISEEITATAPDPRVPVPTEELKLIANASDIAGLEQSLSDSLLLKPSNVSLMSQEQIAEAGKTIAALSKFLETQRATDPELVSQKLSTLGRISRNLLAADKANPLELSDFDKLSAEQIKTAVSGQAKPNLSVDQIKGVADTMVIAAAAKAAALAQQQKQDGKKETPEKVIPNASSIGPKEKQLLKELAEKAGMFSAQGLNVAIQRIVGPNSPKKVQDAAKAIYLAYELLADK